MKTNIVIGLGYGDEGKGLTTEYLCRQSEHPLVIRFSGGHQAGHTVVHPDGTRHVFSNFGAGTLLGVPTYWSAFCSFNPVAYWNELQDLKKKGLSPTLFLDAMAPVTTPFDIFYNRKTEKDNQHGSCGVGFGATMSRQLTPYKFYAQDLLYPAVVKQRLNAIGQYYIQQSGNPNLIRELGETLDLFLHLLDELRPQLKIVQEQTFFQERLTEFDQLVFEGSQGILLDMDHGFFPNVTYANTTTKNALDLLKRNGLFSAQETSIYYITRGYQTRHGNGFLSNEGLPFQYQANPNETNQYNEWQGHQRVSPLDIDLLNYAIQCDQNYSGTLRKNLVVTCLDQIDGPIIATSAGNIHHLTSSMELLASLKAPIRNLMESHSDCSANMILRKRPLIAA